MVLSQRNEQRTNNCVAVIGDGAITGGMAFEAMNCAGYLNVRHMVILNDNGQVKLSLFFLFFFLLLLSLLHFLLHTTGKCPKTLDSAKEILG